jgi:NDP-hexose-3-ketoreductase
MTDKIKLVVWGLGRHANKRILSAIDDSKSIELSGICTRNQTLGKEKAYQMGCRYFYSGDEMLSDPNIETVFLCTPTGLHFTQGQSVLQAGKHLWCEKPITTTFAHSLQLIELAQDKNLFVGEAYMYKYHQQFKKLKNIVENMRFGRLMRLICRFSISALDQPGFRINLDLVASALLDLGSYTFSIVDELFEGQPIIELAEYYQDEKAIDQNGFCVLGCENETLKYSRY